MPEFLADPITRESILLTLGRVAGAFLAAIVTALAVAITISKAGLPGRVLSIYINLLLGVPSTIAALIALFIFRTSPLGIFVVVWLMILPFIVVILVEGLKSLDTTLTQMAHVYGFSKAQRARHLLLPHMVPYTFAAIRNEHAHAWRVVIVAELFAVSGGMGASFNRAFSRLLLVDVILWLLVFILTFLFVEFFIVRPSERRALRWRQTVS